MSRTMNVVRRGMEEGVHIGGQVFVSVKGEPVLDWAVGEARPGVAMGTATLMVWMSSTKPIAAVAIAQLWEKGLLELDDLVTKFIPEFGQNGKQNITIRHLLTHTAGIRGLIGKWEEQSWDQIIAMISAMRVEPGWEVGKKAGYHTLTSWYVLGEIVRRADGRAFEKYVREEIFLPIGMTDSWVGLPGDAHRAYGDRIGLMHDTFHGEPRVLSTENEEGAARVRPGANGRGPIRELGKFYEMLLKNGLAGGKQILLPQTVEAMTARHRVGLYDQTFKHLIDWGLGIIVNSHYHGETVPYGFGPHASLRAFGHSGHQSSTGFADPEYGLAVAWVMNGMPGEKRHDLRVREINSAIYEDLDLA
ncbi:MAG TPA: serine hydrolase domain-containing protein [Tepidisphaeraceae bacterium]